MAKPPPPSPLDRILTQRREFTSFLVSRLGSEADAEDVLQNGLIKAVRSAPELRDGEKITAWFYQILRNAMVDHIRSGRSREERQQAWALDQANSGGEEIERAACRCVATLVEDLKPKEAELVRKVDLENTTVADAAQQTGISANNASVTLHRARKKLRARLEDFCGECASGSCLDCDCSVRHEPL